MKNPWSDVDEFPFGQMPVNPLWQALSRPYSRGGKVMKSRSCYSGGGEATVPKSNIDDLVNEILAKKGGAVESDPDDDGGGPGSDDLEAAAADFISAIRLGDPRKVAAAFRDMLVLGREPAPGDDDVGNGSPPIAR